MNEYMSITDRMYDWDKQTEQLEKENAELKETITKMNNVITETFSKLNKAKEIIRELLPFAKRECVTTANFNAKEIQRAEQFLKEQTYD